MTVLVRTSRPAALVQYYDVDFDRAAGAADDPYQRGYNPAADGECLNDCHAALCQAGRNLDGYYYVHRADCTCGVLSSPLASPLSDAYYSTGACEEWPTGVWATSPSSGPCD